MIWYFHTPAQTIWMVSMFVVSGYALWRGGRPERIIAIANVIAAVISPLMPDSPNAADPEWGTLIIDFLFLSLLVAMALFTDRAWLLFASSFQLLQVIIHLAITVDPRVESWAFKTALIIFSYLVLFSLGVGAWLHTVDRRLNLHYP